jgi:hypothetical protein
MRRAGIVARSLRLLSPCGCGIPLAKRGGHISQADRAGVKPSARTRSYDDAGSVFDILWRSVIGDFFVLD